VSGLADEELLRDRARLVARSAVADGVAAANVGRRDLAAGVAFLQELAGNVHVPWVATNLRDGAGEYPFPRWRILDWGGVSVAVLGVLPADPLADRRLAIRVDPPTEALRDAMAQLPPVEAVICLSTLGLDAEKKLASQVPGIALIVGGGSAPILPNPQAAGDTVILHAADRGRYLGVLDLRARSLRSWKEPRDVQQEPLLEARLRALRQRQEAEGDSAGLMAERGRIEAELAALKAGSAVYANRIVALDGRGGESAEVARWVQDLKAGEAAWRRRAGSAPAQAARPPAPASSGSIASGAGGYAGSASCRECHAGAYQAWLATPHARAYADLKEGARDPRCLECHATRLAREAGVTVEPVVSCEVCHGPGARHRGPDNISRHPGEAQCRRCHRGFHPEAAFEFERDYGSIRCDRSAP